MHEKNDWGSHTIPPGGHCSPRPPSLDALRDPRVVSGRPSEQIYGTPHHLGLCVFAFLFANCITPNCLGVVHFCCRSRKTQKYAKPRILVGFCRFSAWPQKKILTRSLLGNGRSVIIHISSRFLCNKHTFEPLDMPIWSEFWFFLFSVSKRKYSIGISHYTHFRLWLGPWIYWKVFLKHTKIFFFMPLNMEHWFGDQVRLR